MSMFCLSGRGKALWSGARAPSPPREAGGRPCAMPRTPVFGCRDACRRHGPWACQVPGCLTHCSCRLADGCFCKANQVQGSGGIPERNGGHANGCPPISCMRTRNPRDFQTASPKHVFASLPAALLAVRPGCALRHATLAVSAASTGCGWQPNLSARTGPGGGMSDIPDNHDQPERAHGSGSVQCGRRSRRRSFHPEIFFAAAMIRRPCRDVREFDQPPGLRPARRQTRRRARPAEGGLVDSCVGRRVRPFAKAGAAGCVQE